ncbi:MAG: cytochrome C4 [Flavobacteriales bacterium BRH_c54]|nr:MAG: cytochrome C4 [Flavobacteriales bacterium BRH_c54]
MNSINHILSKEDKPIIISGPCSAESEEQLIQTAIALKALNKVDVLRAGIWKPRTKPGSFEGVGLEALKWLQKAKETTGLKTAIEVANTQHVEEALKYDVDVLWIGARTTVNPFVVQEIADALHGTDATVLIKNPINPDLQLWEGAIERFSKVGITKIGAIHRGFSKYGDSYYRNPPQWQIPIELMQHYPNLTMICDPSHICGKRDNLFAVAQKAMDLDFDGLMIEAHLDPDNALSDALQQITPQTLEKFVNQLVVRKTKLSPTLTTELDKIRRSINVLDGELLDVLSKRMELINELAQYKKENNIQILQPKRWEEILLKALEEAKEKGLSERFIRNLFTEIHIESIKLQSKIMNEEN